MSDIIIYTTPEKLLHKQDKLSFEEDDEKSEVGEYYWELRNPPLGLKELGESKIYFATKGFIRGYFEIEDVEWSDNFKIFFYANSWKDIKPIPITHFQGFMYADKVKELMEERKVK